MGDRYPEILSDLAARAAELLQEELGLSQPEAERVSGMLADRVGQGWAGIQVYIGKGAVVTERDRQILREFNGSNHAYLARKFGMTERQIYNIIARIREEETRKHQIPLFTQK